jgi:hypothetical protein
MKAMLKSVALFILTGYISYSEKNYTGYTFIKESKNVRLYYRQVVLPNGEHARELKAESIVKASRYTILVQIKEQNKLKLWMQNTKELKTVSVESSNSWYTYFRYTLPWPMNDQDCILKFSIQEQANGYFIFYESYPDYLLEKKEVNRIRIMRGIWNISSLPNGYCKVEYTVATERNENFPKWVADPFVYRNLVQSMAALRTNAELFKN